MTERVKRIPGADHPIDIVPCSGRVVVRVGDRVIADSHDALTLCEADYPPVQYIPRKDVDMAVLAPSAHRSYCPYKGEAGYFDLVLPGAQERNAVWTYEAPYDAVAAIAGHVAFYPDPVTIMVEQPGD